MNMHQMANPANRLPPDFDDIHPRDYDPEFTADINTKMRIPHRLGLAKEEMIPQPEFAASEATNVRRSMNVPDRIRITGQDDHIGMREDLRFDADPTMLRDHGPYVGLSTPPRSLKLDENIYSATPAELEAKLIAQTQHDAPNGYISGGQVSHVTFAGASDQDLQVTPKGQRPRPDLEALTTPGGGLLLDDSDDDDVARLQRQVMKLTRHVVNLQQENEKRSSREFYLYSGILGYLILQVTKWFIRNN